MLKEVAERVLARGLGPLLSRRHRGRIHVLAYHNVVPEGEPPGGDRSLHLPRRAFADQLDALVESHRVVPLREAVEAVADVRGSSRSGGGDRHGPPRAVITFDDAYRGAVTNGLEELARRGLPATVFVSPGLLGSDGFWWDRLPGDGDHEVGGRLDAGHRRGRARNRVALLGEMAGRGEAILADARRRGGALATPPEHALPVTAEEMREAVDRPGVTVGAHGWSHANMARLDADELEEELVRPRAWLEEELAEAFVPVLAYPYGRCSEATAKAARDAGYRAAFEVTGGSFDPAGADRYRLPRTNVPAGVSVDGFRLRALGLLA